MSDPSPPDPAPSDSSRTYQLLDCGDGRRLERFGPVVLDRPAPEATDRRRDVAAWTMADGRFDRTDALRGRWTWPDAARKPGPAARPEEWQVTVGPVTFQLRTNEYGHVGLFPEHATLWPDVIARLPRGSAPPAVLNLFAYTGGMTLALAAAGATVTHVDAARAVVSAARHNAIRSGLSDAPIRWITEDATRYVEREVKRGRRYDGVILDPPTFGRGPQGEIWKLDRDLPPLLAGCLNLLTGPRPFLVLTCHTPDWTGPRLAGTLREALRSGAVPNGTGRWPKAPAEPGPRLTTRPITLTAASGAILPAGTVVVWDGGSDAKFSNDGFSEHGVSRDDAERPGPN